ncbi:MAG: hypothetical protein BZ135_06640 [Methanosphaera sp. rholeuAM6]|nr:MAG: hypothetical protein BZ135_06640 [Methanosphaera sp. rholeuAM6]
MKIKELIMVKYQSRPNRFTIEFMNDKKEKELAHLHDPGRLKELLIKNTDVLVKYVPDYSEKNRKTKYDVIAIKFQNNWVLLNSGYHNMLVSELIEKHSIEELKEYQVFKPEYTYGNSRLDFLLKDNEDNDMFLEVKGCTLVVDSEAKFPDAPTTRGKKHVDELINIKHDGLNSSIIILVLQNNAKTFTPNYETDPQFSKSLKEAYDSNVKIFPTHIRTSYANNELKLEYDKILPITFRKNKKTI